jgi:DNA-binding NarL/FixJ family response regulator
MIVIRVVSELIFSSKISETCRALGIESKVAKNKEKLNQLLGEDKGALVIVDLGFPEGIGPELAALALSSVGAESVYCFYSHVATEELKMAQSLGLVNIMPRSSFFDSLAQILQKLSVESSLGR